LRFGGSVPGVVAAFTLSAMSLFSLGFVVAGLAPTARVAQVVGMVVFYPMIFLSGATIPREVLPETVRQYSQALPLAHAVSLLRGLWTGGAWGDYTKEVIVLLGLAVMSVIVAVRTFRWE
jgi:ABC-2 type transport system permease protein